MENQTSSKTKPKYRGWLTIRRSKPKQKYHLQNGRAGDNILPYVPSSEEKEEDIPTLLRRLKIIEEADAYHDQQELVTTQRHLIEVLKKENGALRLLRTQIESLRLENHHLRSELDSCKSEQTATANGDGAGDEPVTRPKDDGDGRQTQNGVNGVHESSTNGHNHSRGDELDNLRRDNKELRERLGLLEGGGVGLDATDGRGAREVKGNGAQDAGGNVVGKLKKEPAGPGPSGTSLVTVSCLLKCKGRFHDCDETMAARLKAYMATKSVDLVLKDWQERKDSNQITLVLCHATSSHPLTDIRKALIGVSSDAEIILIVYHTASMNSEKTDPQTDSLDLPHNNICLVVDVFFSKNEGLYRCKQNDRAMSRIYRLFDILC